MYSVSLAKPILAAPFGFGNGQSVLVLDSIAGDSPTATVIAYARVYLYYNVQFRSRGFFCSMSLLLLIHLLLSVPCRA